MLGIVLIAITTIISATTIISNISTKTPDVSSPQPVVQSVEVIPTPTNTLVPVPPKYKNNDNNSEVTSQDTIDPVVLCDYKHSPKVYLNKSACEQSVECLVHDDYWTVSKNNEECNSARTAYYNNQHELFNKNMDNLNAQSQDNQELYDEKMKLMKEQSDLAILNEKYNTLKDQPISTIAPQNPTYYYPTENYNKNIDGYCVRPGVWADSEGLKTVSTSVCP